MGVSQVWTDTFEGVKPSVETAPPNLLASGRSHRTAFDSLQGKSN